MPNVRMRTAGGVVGQESHGVPHLVHMTGGARPRRSHVVRVQSSMTTAVGNTLRPPHVRIPVAADTLVNVLARAGVTRRDLLVTRRDPSQVLLRDAKDYGDALQIILHEFYRGKTSSLAFSPGLFGSVIKSILAGELLNVTQLVKFHRLLITHMTLMYEHLEEIERNNETEAPNFDLIRKMDRMNDLAGVLHEIMQPYMDSK